MWVEILSWVAGFGAREIWRKDRVVIRHVMAYEG